MQSVPTEEPGEENAPMFKIGSESYESDNGAERFSDEDDGEYHDDDDDDNNSGGCCDEEETSAVAASGRRKMKSMSVAMGDDFFDDPENRERSCCCGRYWICWLCCTVLLVTVFIGGQAALQYQKEAAVLYGIIGQEDGTADCNAYDEQTLTIIKRTYEANNDTRVFCQTDFPECQCKHPYRPTKPDDHAPQWTEIQTMNLAQVKKFTKHMQADVALLGDSIIEHFTGLDLGYSGGAWKANKRAFDKVFNRKNGGKVNGVALGIGGDRIQNLLYRLQNGEAPAEFHPRVWWLLIGTNDLEDKCNADTIVVGHFRLVDEIRKFHPGATIVLNSILPRNENPDDLMSSPTWPIIKEINLKLECYANTARGIEFFNATDVFTAHRKGKVVVNQQLMKDQVHPNAEGSRLWGETIADKVVELKQKKRHHHGKGGGGGHHHEKKGNAKHNNKNDGHA